MSHRKRAAKMLIARRAFLSLTFIQATLHACIPACDSTFPKFNRITVYFCKSSLSRRTFPRMKNARPCDFGSQFVRAITRFQRKFSANHAKSAYFQRKSRKISVNKHLPYKRCPLIRGKNAVGRHLAFPLIHRIYFLFNILVYSMAPIFKISISIPILLIHIYFSNISTPSRFKYPLSNIFCM